MIKQVCAIRMRREIDRTTKPIFASCSRLGDAIDRDMRQPAKFGAVPSRIVASTDGMTSIFRSPLGNLPPQAAILAPQADVTRVGDDFLASSREPWLRLEHPKRQALAGRYIELVYDSSLLEPPSRPVLRFLKKDSFVEQILPAPVFGRAIWRGLVPVGTIEIWISPVDREGPFAFRIVKFKILSLLEVVRLSNRPPNTFYGLMFKALGQHDFSARHLRRSLMGTPMKRYSSWKEARRRPVEWDGVDKLSDSAGHGLHIRLILTGAKPNITDVLELLKAQPWPNWSIAAQSDEETAAKVLNLAPTATFNDAMVSLRPSDVVMVASASERWAPESLPIIGTVAQREPHDLFYADEEIVGPLLKPVFKPDWGPIGGRSIDLIGRAWFARVGWARSAMGDRTVDDLSRPVFPLQSETRVKHIARLLLSRPDVRGPAADRVVAGNVSPPGAAAERAASLIIPTRDRADLLRQCVAGLSKTRSPFEVIIVDNGSVENETRALYDELLTDRRFRILSRPGPFNFSALCNDGAREANNASLVFLNNDTEPVAPDWLTLLAAWTSAPTVGAVGAKLLYPDGRLQHAGVIIGIDGHANHYELSAGKDDAGYFNRLLVPHELSAVTGACLAVDKGKFDAVGGFDAINTPVEFSDIDLCLRLGERGWVSLLEPRALLVHHEAATRKVSRDQERRYADQIAYFKNRWRGALRADPFFHPALSLDAHRPALG
jgi:O-antigen biosynthesis protein